MTLQSILHKTKQALVFCLLQTNKMPKNLSMFSFHVIVRLIFLLLFPNSIFSHLSLADRKSLAVQLEPELKNAKTVMKTSLVPQTL